MMKKGNLLLTLTLVVMAALVFCGSIAGTMLQAQAINLQAATKPAVRKLFDTKGDFAVNRGDIKKGAVFNFFGYDWYVVNVNDEADVATFWMVKPYGDKKDGYRYVFNEILRSGTGEDEIFATGATIWRNGYTNSVWNGDKDLGESTLRATMRQLAVDIIDQKEYAAYKKKVVPGYVEGANMDNKNASIAVSTVYCAVEAPNSVDKIISPAQTLTAYYDLAIDGDDRLWLPSIEEIRDNGFWRLDNTYRNWTDTTVDNVAWLRTPVNDESTKAMLVGYATKIGGVEQNQSNYKAFVDQAHGVRPAIHINLKDYTGGAKGGWFTDDMMKVFFIIICVLGIVGVVLVITAVVIKARKNKQA